MVSWLQPTRQEKENGEKNMVVVIVKVLILLCCRKASPNSTPMESTHKIDCDNNSKILLIKCGANNSKGKHIDMNYHYIQDMVEMGKIEVNFIPSIVMVNDPMIMELPLGKFKEHLVGM